MDRRLLEYSPVLETFEPNAPRGEAGWGAPSGAAPTLDEGSEMSLAAELLAVTSPSQLERFLTNLVARAAPAGAQLARSPAGAALVGLLKRAAQPVLPARSGRGGVADVARAFALQRGPGLIAKAGRLFGLELEGLSPEDKEFALAQQFVRFASAAARNAGLGRGPAPALAQQAVRSAALRHAPGLLTYMTARPAHGRWIRQGERIVVLDC